MTNFVVGELQNDDFVFELESDAAQKIYQIWTSSLKV